MLFMISIVMKLLEHFMKKNYKDQLKGIQNRKSNQKKSDKWNNEMERL